MKRKVNICLYLFLILILLGGCRGEKDKNLEIETLIEEDFDGLEEDLNNYTIDIKVDEKGKSYRGKQRTRFKNASGVELKEIYFRLYPNAFKDFERSPSILGDSNEYTFKAGFINMEDVSIGGESVEYEIEGEDETLLRIELPQVLLLDQEIQIDMDYFVKLPTSKDRFGYGKNTMNFGNGYPVLSVYDEYGWSKDPYCSIGDPFYTDLSNYRITISVDKDIVIASSGNILEEKIVGEKKIYKIEGKLIRDFAFVASRDFKVAEEEVDGTLIKLYYLEEDRAMVKEAMKASGASLRVFNEEFGKYPYGTYSVVLTEFPSGMEYPTIVFISKDLFKREFKDSLEQTIVHETAHQWWYGLVGSNQVKEAWLDEGLTSYSEIVYMDKIYGEEEGDLYFKDNFEIGFSIVEKYLKGLDQRINKPLDEFEDWSDYGPLVYTKATMFLRDIEEKYDKEILLKILKAYFDKYKYKIATTEDFLKICQEVTGDSFDSMSQKWLE